MTVRQAATHPAPGESDVDPSGLCLSMGAATGGEKLKVKLSVHNTEQILQHGMYLCTFLSLTMKQIAFWKGMTFFCPPTKCLTRHFLFFSE